MSLYVYAEDFDEERYLPFSITSGKSLDGSSDFKTIDLKYRYKVKLSDGSFTDTVGPLVVRFRYLKTKRGICYSKTVAKTSEPLTRDKWVEWKGKLNQFRKDNPTTTATYKILASIPVNFEMTNEQTRNIVGTEEVEGFYTRWYRATLERLLEIKEHLDKPKAKNAEAFEDIFESPVRYPKDKMTNQPMLQSNPSHFYQLKDRGVLGSMNRDETKFSLPTKEKGKYRQMPWEELSNVEMEFAADVQFSCLMYAVKQLFLKDNILDVTIRSIKGSNSESSMTDFLDEMSKDCSSNAVIEQADTLLKMRHNAIQEHEAANTGSQSSASASAGSSAIVVSEKTTTVFSSGTLSKIASAAPAQKEEDNDAPSDEEDEAELDDDADEDNSPPSPARKDSEDDIIVMKKPAVAPATTKKAPPIIIEDDEPVPEKETARRAKGSKPKA